MTEKEPMEVATSKDGKHPKMRRAARDIKVAQRGTYDGDAIHNRSGYVRAVPCSFNIGAIRLLEGTESAQYAGQGV